MKEKEVFRVSDRRLKAFQSSAEYFIDFLNVLEEKGILFVALHLNVSPFRLQKILKKGIKDVWNFFFERELLVRVFLDREVKKDLSGGL